MIGKKSLLCLVIQVTKLLIQLDIVAIYMKFVTLYMISINVLYMCTIY